jgi:hypothetical protein
MFLSLEIQEGAIYQEHKHEYKILTYKKEYKYSSIKTK